MGRKRKEQLLAEEQEQKKEAERQARADRQKRYRARRKERGIAPVTVFLPDAVADRLKGKKKVGAICLEPGLPEWSGGILLGKGGMVCILQPNGKDLFFRMQSINREEYEKANGEKHEVRTYDSAGESSAR